MAQTIFALGMELPSVSGFEALPLNTSRSWLDADIVVVRPTFDAFTFYDSYAGVPTISEGSSPAFRELLQRWDDQVRAALAAGKLLVFFLPAKVERYYHTGRTEQRGTPGRPNPVKIVSSCSNYDFIPARFSGLTAAVGERMVLTSGADALSTYWAEFGSRSVYRVYFAQGDWTPLVRTKSGNHIVGASYKKDGVVLLLPDLSFEDVDEDDVEEDEDKEGYEWPKDSVKLARSLRDALHELSRRLTKGSERTPPPEWAQASNYRFTSEERLEVEIEEVEGRIDALAKQRDELRLSLEEEASLRDLLFETGDRLETAVRSALFELGFDAEHFKEGDSEFDAVFKSAEGRFLGEVEGKENKAINVDKFSQLQRNLGEDFAREEVDEMAVGVLFGNAFRLKPPGERGDFFTEKVLAGAARSNIALVRTTDLFTVSRALRNSPNAQLAAKCRKAIRDGVGGIVEFPEVPEEVAATAAEAE